MSPHHLRSRTLVSARGVEVKLDTASIQVVEVKIASAQDKVLGSLSLISALDMEVEITSARDVVGREA
ncbi:hypothetical protein B296_00008768 [Ensete ventricosum]|uniref:Uncharacterized protein n=1 Tax=Ensete ventricosum TaxID=4639 RepID=A0A427AHR6_ENSVE|nr:hypothetical protein B296_00008768 [Ensete ventricosum]